MDFENFEEEKPKIPTNLLVFVIVSALVIAFSIYYISRSGKNQTPLTTEELVDGDTLQNEESMTEEDVTNNNMEDTGNSAEEELTSEDLADAKPKKSEKKSESKQEVDFSKEESKSKKTPVKTVSNEKKVTEKKTEKVADIKGIMHIHTVRKNEFLSTISGTYNFPSRNIRDLNGLSSDELRVGQKIKVKVQAIHKVKSGEQLGKIAEKYHVKTADICKINGVRKDSGLKEGQKLIIPLKSPPK